MKKSARPKLRYLLISIAGPRLNQQRLSSCVSDAVLSYFGASGAAEASVRIVEFSEQDQIAVVSCHHNMLDKVLEAFAIFSGYSTPQLALHVSSVSGTLRKLKDRYKKMSGERN